ncbi:MAG: hypothetical protein KDK51_09375 [Deltaproteobacteria bacterium]|nr:hypothetical protein [Deltaproteobacteria bacterium]
MVIENQLELALRSAHTFLDGIDDEAEYTAGANIFLHGTRQRTKLQIDYILLQHSGVQTTYDHRVRMQLHVAF